jgi:hypothetical protein
MAGLWIFVLIISVTGLPSGAIAMALTHYKPDWPKKRVILSAALPLPLLLWILSGVVMVDAMTAPKEQCGVDACGMAASSGFFGLFLGIVMFVTGLVAAAWVYRAFGLDEEESK